MHPGTYMTVAVIEKKDWLGSDESVLDKDKVTQTLNEYDYFWKTL